ncbi:MAG: ThuA domain-containing protein [Alphaproteobacteria bacterium]|nr:ThuA domain-containing protein [Alphaproteobacteria bacterium]
MTRNLIITGGIFHPFEDTSAALSAQLSPLGVVSTVSSDIEEALAELDRYDLLTVNCLRWRMIQAERHAPYRDEWAMELSASARDAVSRFVREGGALLGLHTAGLCFDTWPEWQTLLGATWDWDRSYHPPLGDVEVEVRTDAHPIVAGLADFDTQDEVFHHLTSADDAESLLFAELDDGRQPLLWARQVGKGRAVYDALGHSPRSIEHPVHARILRRAALWALGRPDAEVAAA